MRQHPQGQSRVGEGGSRSSGSGRGAMGGRSSWAWRGAETDGTGAVPLIRGEVVRPEDAAVHRQQMCDLTQPGLAPATRDNLWDGQVHVGGAAADEVVGVKGQQVVREELHHVLRDGEAAAALRPALLPSVPGVQ